MPQRHNLSSLSSRNCWVCFECQIKKRNVGKRRVGWSIPLKIPDFNFLLFVKKRRRRKKRETKITLME